MIFPAKRVIMVRFPYRTGTWETWCAKYDFHQLCDELGLEILYEADEYIRSSCQKVRNNE